MNEIDVIKGAREILAAGRWHKGALEDGVGNYCIVGALRWANQGDDNYAQVLAEEALVKHVHIERLPNHGVGALLVKYNDNPNTTLQDMLDLIDKTLADLGAL